MKRRDILGVAAAFAINALASGRAMSCAVSIDGQDVKALTDHLLQAYPIRNSLAFIGDAYWQEEDKAACPDSRSLASVLDSFLSHVDLDRDRLRRLPSAALRDVVRARTVRDFSHGRTVKISGWLLSETETKLCTLAAIRLA